MVHYVFLYLVSFGYCFFGMRSDDGLPHILSLTTPKSEGACVSLSIDTVIGILFFLWRLSPLVRLFQSGMVLSFLVEAWY